MEFSAKTLHVHWCESKTRTFGFIFCYL